MNKLFYLLMLSSAFSWANHDSTFLNKEKSSKFCKPRIIGMSPNKIISIGYDFESNQRLNESAIGSYKKNEKPIQRFYGYTQVQGFRFSTRFPIVNKESILWQIGLNYAEANYINNNYSNLNFVLGAPLSETLLNNGLKTAGFSTSIFKPLNSKTFIIVFTSADRSGDYNLKNIQFNKHLKYTALAIYGKRPNDRKQWGIGLGRNYGAGQSSILPLIMFNYTSINKKWGAEVFLPGRAFYRRNINKNSIIRVGYELEGQSYRIGSFSSASNNYELRRGQLRAKLEYQCKIYKSFWLSTQGGYCNILNFKVDNLGNSDKDFTRNISGQHNYAMINKLSNFWFFNVSVNFVSL